MENLSQPRKTHQFSDMRNQIADISAVKALHVKEKKREQNAVNA
jgi:hypothetical protein